MGFQLTRFRLELQIDRLQPLLCGQDLQKSPEDLQTRLNSTSLKGNFLPQSSDFWQKLSSISKRKTRTARSHDDQSSGSELEQVDLQKKVLYNVWTVLLLMLIISSLAAVGCVVQVMLNKQIAVQKAELHSLIECNSDEESEQS
ncbi:unnamed protein product [Nesidiocoris tenuis]|uniref:Uncharacterized protein n=1 Tax=Nesidiocoris tenuis TaxID=355587 RepID=A0A6H5GWD1_9HEMI|nr:unnamed protein product [Nesidiocoris tenuis]